MDSDTESGIYDNYDYFEHGGNNFNDSKEFYDEIPF